MKTSNSLKRITKMTTEQNNVKIEGVSVKVVKRELQEEYTLENVRDIKPIHDKEKTKRFIESSGDCV